MTRDPGQHVKVTATTQPVAIWSGEHRAWWGPNRCGYFGPAGAGIYTLQEAIDATHHVGPEKLIEIRDVPAPALGINAELLAALKQLLAFDGRAYVKGSVLAKDLLAAKKVGWAAIAKVEQSK